MKKTITVIGGAGYVARELIACLTRHPQITIQEVVSESQTGYSESYAEGWERIFGKKEDITEETAEKTKIKVKRILLSQGYADLSPIEDKW